MTKKIVSLVSLVASAGAVAFTAIPAQAWGGIGRVARFENSELITGLVAFGLVAFAAAAVATRLAYAKKLN